MSSTKAKPVADSRAIINEIVLPNDTNSLGNMMGGRLLHLMDKCAAISAQRHANTVCVTASVDNVEFQAPIRGGDVVVIESQVNRAFRTSMEVELNVWAENPKQQTKLKSNRAFYTFVGLDDESRPVEIPPIQPETEEEKERYDAAAKRREIRLVLAGRLGLEDATNLREDMRAAIQASPSHS
ncbi:acyl-CoA thioesterase [Longibacter salinarum]|uniref:Acyl-CoA thioesterase n=1 Tax=Longibacter salinarum TaxID=1850348 RepID=A0A2A8CZ51_9BACT|nr:acyl-CoA thioesterase [Longibacter salinarum]PEN13914.1 acyl-CoA thioesterase [Longibacter salinarum]